MRLLGTFILFVFFSGMLSASSVVSDNGIKWRDWSDEAFSEAQRDGKFLILDLEAVWCHWCHVMEEKTYSDPAVIELINKHFIALKVDQDNRPDLSRRYQDWGWPATIFFNADGVELVKRAGYIPPDGMQKLLQAIIDDPSPERGAPIQAQQVFTTSPLLSDDIRKLLEKRHFESYDPEYGSLKINQKFIDRDTVEYALHKVRYGDSQNERIARHTLDEAIALIDPVWGGVYQYSTGGKWDYPHFEKIMQSQAGYMRIYALAYRLFGEKRYLKAAEDIARYLENFLTAPNGALYTSQDADLVQGVHSREYFELDDKARREQGIPKVDTHQYARENAWAARALSVLYQVSGNKEYLARAEGIVDWVERNRNRKGGGYNHDERDKGGPFLGDNLAMAEAYISLYQSNGRREYIQRAHDTLRYIDRTFRYGGDEGAGYAVAYAPATAVISPLPQIDENIALARLAIRVYHLTADKSVKAISKRTMRFLATPEIATERLTEAGILLAEYELVNDPDHITIVGHKDNKQAQALYREALRYPGSYRRIEWWDKREGEMPNPDVQYPSLSQAAAFACSNQRCSLPVFNATDIHPMVDALNGRP